jgi:dinuclear metal center YbgI/SA1388 family protein
MPTIADLCDWMQQQAPLELAAAWDNVGLLVGDRRAAVQRVMTCLTLTEATAQEAVDGRAHLVLVHHPLPFRPLNRLTTDTKEGRMLLALVAGGVAVYSAHTAFDSAARGINQQLAEGLALGDIAPLVPAATAGTGGGRGDLAPGSGRYGRLPGEWSLGGLVARLKQFLGLEHVKVVGSAEQPIRQPALACGSAGEYLAPAATAGCDCLVTGETSFHTCLEAEARGIALVLLGHYASERFGMEALAAAVGVAFPTIEAWASRREVDPLVWM